MVQTDILSMNIDEIKSAFSQLSLPAFRAGQVFDWLHNKLCLDYDKMTNLPKDMREKLKEEYPLLIPQTVQSMSSSDGTIKMLYSLYDGDYIESVIMKYKYGYTVCVSSQVGCKMGCAFCASTLGGFKRNLTAGEILSQVYIAQNRVGERISHIVMMGMGEPLDNFDNVKRFLDLVTDKNGLNLSMRNISLSTCGVVSGVERLLSCRFPLTLSISLHAPNNEIRNSLMPINRRFDIDELLNMCKKYSKETSRRISFEYSMIKGVNDSDECALQLAKRLKGMLCHVNLIPINRVKESPFLPSDSDRISSFSSILEKNGITVTVRRRLGSDINASCGQLRQKQNETNGGECK